MEEKLEEKDAATDLIPSKLLITCLSPDSRSAHIVQAVQKAVVMCKRDFSEKTE